MRVDTRDIKSDCTEKHRSRGIGDRAHNVRTIELNPFARLHSRCLRDTSLLGRYTDGGNQRVPILLKPKGEVILFR